MNLRNLKNLIYRQETTEGIVNGKVYESSRRFGVGLGTLAPDRWWITVEEENGNVYEMSSTSSDFFYPCGLNEGDKIRVEFIRILGIPIYRKLEIR